MDTRQRDKEKEKEKDVPPGERTPKGTKRTKSRRGKEVAGASVPVVGDGTNPTQVLPAQTGLVNNETGEPLGPILPTEVQVDNLGEQQELGCEEEGESSHAGDQPGHTNSGHG
ncbi:hypothetical protein Bca52824_074247 [Brassica carinata]|uniref:GAGE domain-containing protein n=1 Tax=Brassica carinata TaxID=52824 RepID=A0A8X7QFI5_BRACI|nr:hypothetical protein Bca52824_074247 [Brassica carinata]